MATKVYQYGARPPLDLDLAMEHAAERRFRAAADDLGKTGEVLDLEAGAGRPRTRPEGARKVQVVLSPAAAQAWAAHEGDRSAWVSGLIEAACSRLDAEPPA